MNEEIKNSLGHAPEGTTEAFDRLYSIIRRLRAPGGCPWDREQTPTSLRETLIEESYEAIEAITEASTGEGSPLHVREELGDVFLNVTMLAYMYEQEGAFSVTDSLDDVCEKLVRRHPHVFGETAGFAGPESSSRTDTAEKVLAQWDVIKRGVEGRKADSILDEVSRGMPALERAAKLQKKAAKSGFDWTTLDDVWPKVDEELAELREAVAGGDHDRIEDELGDLLFAVVNISRHLKVDPGVALTRTNAKFTRRFKHVEKSMKAAGVPMDKNHLREMDSFWDEAKRAEKDSATK
jgi:tetrapyrrole methylase family protein/MazG family protein